MISQQDRICRHREVASLLQSGPAALELALHDADRVCVTRATSARDGLPHITAGTKNPGRLVLAKAPASSTDPDEHGVRPDSEKPHAGDFDGIDAYKCYRG